LLTPALSSAAATSSSEAVFADTFDPAALELLVGAPVAVGALALGVVVEPPQAARPRASNATTQVEASRSVTYVIRTSYVDLATRRPPGARFAANTLGQRLAGEHAARAAG
jgi:hypothetical protein